METIIRGKQYKQNAQLHSYKKRLLLYNLDNKVLIYNKSHGIYIPSIIVSDEINYYEEIKKLFGISFQNEDVEELIKIISYDFRCQSVNNKLIKNNLKFIRDYYSCLANLDEQLELSPIKTKNGYVLWPEIMEIDEVIEKINKCYHYKQNDKRDALEALKQKIKEKTL